MGRLLQNEVSDPTAETFDQATGEGNVEYELESGGHHCRVECLRELGIARDVRVKGAEDTVKYDRNLVGYKVKLYDSFYKPSARC